MDQLHFILIPLMSQSHLLPFIDLARLLAARGPAVTILTTPPLNPALFIPTLPHDPNSKINLLPLPLPTQKPGLPGGCETLDALPSVHLFEQFLAASSLLRAPLRALLQTLNPKPSCIVADVVLPWTSQVAAELHIPRLVFHVISCFTLLCSHNIRTHKALESVKSDSEPFPVPAIRERVEFIRPQLPGVMSQQGSFTAAMKEAEESADGVLVNTFQELEPSFVSGYKSLVAELWCIGPVSLSHNHKAAGTTTRAASTADRCLRWLDTREAGSVIYACFGTQSLLKFPQLVEIGLGLEATGRPFIWIIRDANYDKDNDDDSIESWLSEQGGFEERVGKRGLVIKGWAPQVSILSHRAVGGFVSHCGWNSTLEAVSSGVPMVTWPLGAEQFFNEKLVVQFLRTGVRVGVERLCMEEESDSSSCFVKRGVIRRAVEELMGEGEEALERRERARELGKVAKRAVEEGGSSQLNLAKVIQLIMDKSNIHKGKELEENEDI